MTTASPIRRFTRPDDACPICGGWERAPRGQGVRCMGFLSSDGLYAHCSREEHAGSLNLEGANTYAHRLEGDCRCGRRHGGAPVVARMTPAQRNGHHPTQDSRPRVVARYDYEDEDGRLLFQVQRTDRKDFWQRQPCRDEACPRQDAQGKRFCFQEGGGWWHSNIAGVQPVLYRAPQLAKADRSRRLWVSSGEKDVATLEAFGELATTAPGGEVKGKWLSDYTEALAGWSEVVVLQDNDATGAAHVQRVAASLHGHVETVKVLLLPGLPEHGDVTDWIEMGHSLDELLAQAEETRPWSAADAAESTTPSQVQDAASVDQAISNAKAHGDPSLIFAQETVTALARLTLAEREAALAKLSAIFGRRLSLRALRAAIKEAANTVSGTTADPGLVKRLATAICDERPFAQDNSGALYHFDGGVYQAGGEEYVRRQVKSFIETWRLTKEWSSHLSNEVVEFIRVDSRRLWEVPPADQVNVANGLLDVQTGVLMPHSADFLSPVQIPITYDPSATCPKWEQFIAQVLPSDTQHLPFEILANVMTPNRDIQKAILFLGNGSNGKTTLLRAIKGSIGEANHTSISLHQLEEDKFSKARLVGKLLNACADLPSRDLESVSVFKMLTGDDGSMEAEIKFQGGFSFTPYTKLLFSANQPPKSKDSSHGFFRRWIVVPFDKVFEEGKNARKGTSLDQELLDPKELSGVLNRALVALRTIRAQGGFTISPSMATAWNELRAVTDLLAVWLDQHTVTSANAFAVKGEVLVAYNQRCEEEGRGVMTASMFTRSLKALRPNLIEMQRTVGGKVVWVWVGLGLKSG